MKTEWEVYLLNGTTMDSERHRWEDVPDNSILVVRWWGEGGKGRNWGDSLYGLPGTYKGGAIVKDEVFAEAMRQSEANSIPPSKRVRG